jgi:hypothetical protein
MVRRRWLVGPVVLLACGGNPVRPPGPDPDPDVDQDLDGDGVLGKLDCDDHDPNVYPGAPELCDFKPNGCSAAPSETGTAAFFPRTGKPRDVTAMLAAGTMAAPAALDLAEPGTLNLCAGTFFVSIASDATSLTVRGAGAKTTILSGGGVARVLTMIPDGSTLDVAGVTLQDGIADDGGAIAGDGTLTLAGTAFAGNKADAEAPSGWGGAVLWIGTATIRDTTFERNAAATAGGALGVQGSLTLRDSTFASNISTAGGGVAAIDGTIAIEAVNQRDNRALREGGAIFLQDATSTLRSVSMVANSATVSDQTNSAFGGAVSLVGGRATLEDCTLASGRSSTGGGGMFLTGSEVVIKRSRFEANESIHFNGLNPSVFSGFGGAIEVVDSRLRVEDSSIAQNQGRWGFGIFVEHGTGAVTVDVHVVNTTFTSNRNILGEAASAPLEYWRANSMQSFLLEGVASFHCDNIGCASGE